MSEEKTDRQELNRNLAQMLKGGVIMDVTTPEQAKIAEALRRIGEGATMIRTKGEPGTGDVVQAVRHMHKMQSEIRRVVSLREDELYEAAKELAAPLKERIDGGLPVFAVCAGLILLAEKIDDPGSRTDTRPELN